MSLSMHSHRQLATGNGSTIQLNWYMINVTQSCAYGHLMQLLYNFDRFISHASQGVPDVLKYGWCHGVTKGPDERSENVTNHIVAILA
jgi:hypothetical protein